MSLTAGDLTSGLSPTDMMARVSGKPAALTGTGRDVKANDKSTINYAGLDPKDTQDAPDPARAVIENPELDPAYVKHGMIVRTGKANWEKNKYAKIVTDGRLLKCLRMARGEYSAGETALLAATGANSTIYMKIAAVKCAALASWLQEILLSPGDRPVGLEPRHLPKLPDPVRDAVQKHAFAQARQRMVQAFSQGQPPMDQESFAILAMSIRDELEDEVKYEYRQRAQKASEKMEDCVLRQMDDGGFDQALRDFTEHFSRYMTAFLKGPYEKRQKTLTWGPNWQPVVEDKPKLSWRSVPPFDIYPPAMARSPQDGCFIERMRLSFSDLFDCIGIEGYDDDAIRWALSTHQSGLLKNWIWTDAERARLENDATYSWFAQDDLIDALHCWDSVAGSVLMQWGVKGDIDPQKQYEVDYIIIGARCVRLAINNDPLGRRPYYCASYEANPDSIWGLNAVPELCEASQDACNAAARAIINNMGIASGPQVWIDTDRVAPGEVVTQLYPWKVWQFNKPDPGQTGAAATPMQFFQPDSVVQELMAVYKTFKQESDDTTGIPAYSYGDEQVQGAGSTMGGLSMLMGAAARRVRRAIGAIDFGVIMGTTFDVFVWCMRNIDDPQIKGDCVVVPRGSAALLIKEQMQQGRQMALQIALNNRIIQLFLGGRGIAELVKGWFAGVHMPNLIPDGPELEKRIEMVDQMLANPAPPPAQIQAQAKLQIEQGKDKTRRDVEAGKIKKDLLIHGISDPGADTGAQTQQGPGGGGLAPQQQPGLQSLPGPGGGGPQGG